MKYIPGQSITINRKIVQGYVKKFFVPGYTYKLYNILRKENEVVYTFTDGRQKFDIKLPSIQEGDKMIDYLVGLG